MAYVDVVVESFKAVVGMHNQQVVIRDSGDNFTDGMVDFSEMFEEHIVVFVVGVFIGVPEKMHESVGGGEYEHERLPILGFPKVAVGLDSGVESFVEVLEEKVHRGMCFLSVDIETIIEVFERRDERGWIDAFFELNGDEAGDEYTSHWADRISGRYVYNDGVSVPCVPERGGL